MRKGTKLRLRCPRCGRAFLRPGSLQAHLNRHREADEWVARHVRKETP